MEYFIEMLNMFLIIILCYTEPLKDFYAAKGLLRPIENQPTIEATSVVVMEALGI